MKNTKKLLVVLTVLALVICGGIAGIYHYKANHIKVNGVWYSRDASELDLRGTVLTTEQYEALRATLPQCRIFWNVPFQNGYFQEDITELTVASLSPEDITQLAYLPQLQQVNAEGCRDYDQLLALQKLYPDLEVSYTVMINGQDFPADTTEISLTDADIQELTEVLPYLRQVDCIRLEGTLPEADALNTLTAAYPEIEFYWQIEVCGVQADVHTTELELSNIPMETVEEVEAAVAYLPSLERVIMCECGISNEEMDALGKRNPDVRFVWSVAIGNIQLRTDTVAFITPPTTRLRDEEAYNFRYCVDMVCLDLGHRRITNCEFVAFMPKLKYLILADTSVTDISPLANHTELVYLELFMSRVTDYSPLLTCTALEDLNICYTEGSIDVIAQMTWLKRLWWGPDEDEKHILEELLPDTEVAIFTGESTGRGWRKGEHYYAQRDMLGMHYMN